MNHAEALRLRLAEKYLLGELSTELREGYEEHCFECTECAADLKASATFMAAAREVLRSESAPQASPSRAPERTGWLAWLRPTVAAPALGALLLLAGYQNFVAIPRMKQSLSQATNPQVLKTFSLMTHDSRGGGEPLVVLVERDQQFALYLDIVDTDARFASYRCDVEGEDGKTLSAMVVSAEQAKREVQVLFSESRLGPGRYTLVIRGIGPGQASAGADTILGRYPFVVQLTP